MSSIAPASNSRPFYSTLRHMQREIALAIVLAVTIALVAAVNPAFLGWQNLRDILLAAAPAAIVGCGLTFVILTGGIDISVGSQLGMLAAILGLLASPSHAGLPLTLALPLTLLAGIIIGLANGLLVTVGKVPSIIVTLGMLTILRGATELLMGGRWITDLPGQLRFCAIGTFAAIPIPLWTATAVLAVCLIIARHTPLGRRIYAVGSNANAARIAGLRPQRIALFVFTLTGALVGVATIISVPQQSVVESGIGVGFELLVVTCVVVGGTSISGGRGTLAGTMLAVLLLSIVRSMLIFLKLGPSSTYWERAIQGAFILVAVLADHFGRRREARA